MRIPVLLAVAAVLSCCASDERADATQPSSAISVDDPRAGSPRLAASIAESVEADAGHPLAVPRSDYQAIAEEACQMSGGSCVAMSACGPDVGVRLPIVCRPGAPGLTCCRKPANECPGYENATCCRTANGRLTNSGALCDRGYPTCLGFASEYHLAADRACTQPLAEAKDAPSRWPGTVGAQAAGQWACEQAGGRTLAESERCDGFRLALGIAPCCIPRALCPEWQPGSECCRADGTLEAKECVNGWARCSELLVQIGRLREVPAGTCKAF